MAITAEKVLGNVRSERPSLLDSLARLADPAGALEAHPVLSGPEVDEQALARDMEAVANDVRAAFEELRAEVDERR